MKNTILLVAEAMCKGVPPPPFNSRQWAVGKLYRLRVNLRSYPCLSGRQWCIPLPENYDKVFANSLRSGIQIRALLSVLVLFIFFQTLNASNRYWVSNTPSNWYNTANWSSTSGGSGGASVPGAADTVFFDTGGIGNCSLDVNINIKGLNVTAGYTGTLSQGIRAITIGAAGATFSGGVFAGGSANIFINGNFAISGTAFTNTSATLELTGDGNLNLISGTFAHNNGKVKLFAGTTWGYWYNRPISGSFQFYHLEINPRDYPQRLICTIDPSFPITVNSELFFSGVGTGGIYRLNGGTVICEGDIRTLNYNMDTLGGGNATLYITGNGNQVITGSGSYTGFLPENIIINKSGGTLTLKSIIALTGHLIIDTANQGIIDGTTYSPTLSFYIKTTNRIANINGSFTVHNLWLFNGGRFQMTPATRITVNNEFAVNPPPSWHTGDPININGGIIYIKDKIKWYNNSIHPYSGGTGTLYFNGTADQVLQGSGNSFRGHFPNVTIDKPSGTLYLKSIITTGGDTKWEYIRGNVDATTFKSQVHFMGGSQIDGEGLFGSMRFYDVRFISYHLWGWTFSLAGDMLVNHNFFLTGGEFKLNGNTLWLENHAPNALMTALNGGIISEQTDNTGIVRWNIGDTVAAYTIPYLRGTTLLPLTMSITTAGTGKGNFTTSTYHTSAANGPFPKGVTNLNDTSDNDVSLKAADRFWRINATGFTTPPVADVTFRYLQGEVAAPNTINEINLKPYRWSGAQWVEDSVGLVNPVANYVEAKTITQYGDFALVERFDALKAPPQLCVDIFGQQLPSAGPCNIATLNYCIDECGGDVCPMPDPLKCQSSGSFCCICPNCVRRLFTVVYQNNGDPNKDVNNCLLKIQLLPYVQYLSSSPCNPTNISGDISTGIILQWNNLCDDPLIGCSSIRKGGTSGTITITTEVACCLSMPTDLEATANISPGSCPDNDFTEYFCSFDPNSKQLLNHNPCEFVAKTDSLIYRVNFQNIGTGPAENIAIIDTLDINVDISTLTTLNASHEYDFTLIPPNVAIWAFKNINLPDSASDPVSSNGFVEFSVKPLSTIAAGTKVIDRAAILFDFNPPVITNTIDVYIESPPLVVNAGNDDTVYYGHAPAESTTLAAVSTSGIGTISYLWSTGETTSSITVSPTETTEYIVIIIDEIGCNAVDEVTVVVIDVHCGKNMNKVLICHYPPGNPANAQTICINASDVANHLSQHGDRLGKCSGSAKMGELTDEDFENNEISIFSELSPDIIDIGQSENVIVIKIPDGIYDLSIILSDVLGRKQTNNFTNINENGVIIPLEKSGTGLFLLQIKSGEEILIAKKVILIR